MFENLLRAFNASKGPFLIAVGETLSLAHDKIRSEQASKLTVAIGCPIGLARMPSISLPMQSAMTILITV